MEGMREQGTWKAKLVHNTGGDALSGNLRSPPLQTHSQNKTGIYSWKTFQIKIQSGFQMFCVLCVVDQDIGVELSMQLTLSLKFPHHHHLSEPINQTFIVPPGGVIQDVLNGLIKICPLSNAHLEEYLSQNSN